MLRNAQPAAMAWQLLPLSYTFIVQSSKGMKVIRLERQASFGLTLRFSEQLNSGVIFGAGLQVIRRANGDTGRRVSS